MFSQCVSFIQMMNRCPSVMGITLMNCVFWAWVNIPHRFLEREYPLSDSISLNSERVQESKSEVESTEMDDSPKDVIRK